MATGRPNGRPTECKPEIVDEIIERMHDGESILSICKDDHMPGRSTVMRWISEDRNGFRDIYDTALKARAHLWAEQILDIADDASNDYMEHNDPDNPAYRKNGEWTSRSALRVESRKWLLSKLLPRYSDRQQVDHTSSDGTMSPTSITRTIVRADGSTEQL